MKPFLDENFLLQSKTAERLFHDFAKGMPIIDYHNHLIPDQMSKDIKAGDDFHCKNNYPNNPGGTSGLLNQFDPHAFSQIAFFDHDFHSQSYFTITHLLDSHRIALPPPYVS